MRVFNQLRKLQIQKQNLKNYIYYALGEVILVSIGILIAFKINAWDQEQQRQKRVGQLLLILEQSLEENKREILKTAQEYDTIKFANDIRLKHIGPNAKEPNLETVSIVSVIDTVNLNLASDVNANYLFNEESLSLLDNETRQLLFQYSTHYKVYLKSEEATNKLAISLRNNHQQYVGLLQEAVLSGMIGVTEKNYFDTNYADWFRDRNHQNIVVEIGWKIDDAKIKLEGVSTINQKLLLAIKDRAH